MHHQCAKAADELLTIGNITTSFVLGTTEEGISISGRSVGEINVQLILEKMGGGGHSTVAGVQIKGKTIYEAKQELLQRIDEYFEETERKGKFFWKRGFFIFPLLSIFKSIVLLFSKKCSTMLP